MLYLLPKVFNAQTSQLPFIKRPEHHLDVIVLNKMNKKQKNTLSILHFCNIKVLIGKFDCCVLEIR